MDPVWLTTHVIKNQMHEQIANIHFHAHDINLFAGS